LPSTFLCRRTLRQISLKKPKKRMAIVADSAGRLRGREEYFWPPQTRGCWRDHAATLRIHSRHVSVHVRIVAQLSPVELSIERLTPTMTHDSDSDSPVPCQLRPLLAGMMSLTSLFEHSASTSDPSALPGFLPTRTSSFPFWTDHRFCGPPLPSNARQPDRFIDGPPKHFQLKELCAEMMWRQTELGAGREKVWRVRPKKAKTEEI
jgi:hypothetical protein